MRGVCYFLGMIAFGYDLLANGSYSPQRCAFANAACFFDAARLLSRRTVSSGM